MNVNKNRPDVSDKKLKELGLLKVISVSISDEGEEMYRCIDENGETKFVSAFVLLGE